MREREEPLSFLGNIEMLSGLGYSILSEGQSQYSWTNPTENERGTACRSGGTG